MKKTIQMLAIALCLITAAWGQGTAPLTSPEIPADARVKFFENAFRAQTLGRTQDTLTKMYKENVSKLNLLAEEWSALELDTLTKMKLDPKKFKFDFDGESKLVVVPREEPKK